MIVSMLKREILSNHLVSTCKNLQFPYSITYKAKENEFLYKNNLVHFS